MKGKILCLLVLFCTLICAALSPAAIGITADDIMAAIVASSALEVPAANVDHYVFRGMMFANTGQLELLFVSKRNDRMFASTASYNMKAADSQNRRHSWDRRPQVKFGFLPRC